MPFLIRPIFHPGNILSFEMGLSAACSPGARRMYFFEDVFLSRCAAPDILPFHMVTVTTGL